MTTPKVLFLAWQCPTTRSIVPVGRLLALGASGYEFSYIRAARSAVDRGFAPLVAFPDLEAVYRSRELPALFQNRVMPKSRPEYPSFVRELGLEVGTTPMDILARSGGLRRTDELEVFAPPHVSADGTRTMHVLARAVRHIPHAEEAIAALSAGTQLFVVADYQNDKAAHARLLRTADTRLVGYLPDYLAAEIEKWPPSAQEELRVAIARVNLPPAPTSQRLLCRVELPAGCNVLSGEEYLPIAADATCVAA